MDLTKEHYRSYIFIEMKRGLSPTQIYQHLLQTDLENVPSRTTVFEWHNRFLNGRTSLHDDERIGRPLTVSNVDFREKILNAIKENPRQSTRSLADEFEISKSTVQRILTHDLGLRKVCSTWIPHTLSVSNKASRVSCCQRLIALFDSHSFEELMEKWVTEDETWALFEAMPTKEENKAWQHPSEPRLRVVRPQLTNKKTLLLVAFTGDGKLSVENTAPGDTVTSERYIEFVRHTGDRWRHLRRSPSLLRSLCWQHDNARPHTASNTQAFFRRNGITLIEQSPYSPDLNQCDAWLFKLLKKELRSKKFKDGEEVRSAAEQILRSIPRERFLSEIHSLYKHCRAVLQNNGDYVS